jgi:hypothetical protein
VHLHYPEISISLRQTLFLETDRSYSEPNQGVGWVFHFSNQFLGQKLLDRNLVSQSIVMVEKPLIGPKFRYFSIHSFTQPFQYFHIIIWVDCVALWNEFKVNSTLDVEQIHEH